MLRSAPVLKRVPTSMRGGNSMFGSLGKPFSHAGFASANSKRVNYDVVVIGSDAGAVLAKRIQASCEGKYSVFLAHSNNGGTQESRSTRVSTVHAQWVEEQAISHSKEAIIQSVDPIQRQILFNDSSIVSYQKLIISSDLVDDYSGIEGLSGAISNVNRPVFSSDLSTNARKSGLTWKIPEGGKCFFYIPKDASKLVQEYTFLTVFDRLKTQGKQFEFTIICEGDSLFGGDLTLKNEFELLMKEEIVKRGIRVIYGTKIESISRECETFTSVTVNNTENSREENVNFDQLYSVIPQQVPAYLTSGELIGDSSGLLTVDQQTLQHQKWKHIFGVGSIVDVPTVNSQVGTFAQMEIVRENALRSLKGQSLSTFYNGYSKVSVPFGAGKTQFASSSYSSSRSSGRRILRGNVLSFYQRLQYFLHTHLNAMFNKLVMKLGLFSRCYLQYANMLGRASGVRQAESGLLNLEQRLQKRNTYFVINEQNSLANNQIDVQNIKKSEYFIIKEDSRIEQRTKMSNDDQIVVKTEESVQEQTLNVKVKTSESVEVQESKSRKTSKGNSLERGSKEKVKGNAVQLEEHQRMEEYSSLEQEVWKSSKESASNSASDGEHLWLFQEEQLAAEKTKSLEELRFAAVAQYIKKEEAKKSSKLASTNTNAEAKKTKSKKKATPKSAVKANSTASSASKKKEEQQLQEQVVQQLKEKAAERVEQQL